MPLQIFLASYAYADGKEDLAKKSKNPVGNIISVPFEYWHYDGMANDSSGDALVIKPVYPLGIGKVTLINRFILPFIGIDANTPGQEYGNISVPATNTKEAGFGNFQYQALFTPAEPGKIIWGGGPVFDFPTNSSGLGSDKWSAGARIVCAYGTRQNPRHTSRHDQQLAEKTGVDICQRSVGEDSLSGFGLITLMKRPVRSRMQGVVGAGGEKPPATRLFFCQDDTGRKIQYGTTQSFVFIINCN